MPKDTGAGRNAVLDGLDLPSLRRVWEQTFGAAPPHSLSRTFLRRVLAYERQCRTYGGHSAATRRTLAAMANGTPSTACAFYLFIRVMEITDILSQNVPLEDVQYLVLPPLSVGEMTLRLYGALNYSQNSARDLRCAVNGA